MLHLLLILPRIAATVPRTATITAITRSTGRTRHEDAPPQHVRPVLKGLRALLHFLELIQQVI